MGFTTTAQRPHIDHTSPDGHPLRRNCLLAALPAAEYQRLVPHLQQVQLPHKQVLYHVGEPINCFYFPERSVVSVLTVLEDGKNTEVGLIGYDGIVGFPALLGQPLAQHLYIVQVPDGAHRIELSQLQQQMKQSPTLEAVVLRYTLSFLLQTAQTAACNAQHRLERRLARWLLLVADRVGSAELNLTHEFMADMLSVRRSGVSVAAHRLQAAGLISYRRGKILILDRPRLEQTACECYAILHAELREQGCAAR